MFGHPENNADGSVDWPFPNFSTCPMPSPSRPERSAPGNPVAILTLNCEPIPTLALCGSDSKVNALSSSSGQCDA
jgi:hypothetical protein